MTGLALNRLNRREGLVLVQAVAGNAALPDEIMTEGFERADGVPLFVEELTPTGHWSAIRCFPLKATLFDQLKKIYIDGVLEPVDTTQWYPRIMRKDYTVGLNVTESGVNPAVDKLVDQQSMESDKEERERLVWEIGRQLAADGARPVIFYPRGATCRYARVKGMTVMINSIYDGYRYEAGMAGYGA